MLYIIYQEDRPDGAAVRTATREAHFAYLKEHGDILVLGGALLAGDGQVGRTLDFLIQEINREVNTIGSKADDLEISQAVIAAKSTLEKMREQVANLE
mgnify:CR=1 FL=1